MTTITTNSNDANVTKRVQTVREIVHEVFRSEPLTIHALAYEDSFPFPYNNFVYLVTLDETVMNTKSSLPSRHQFGVDPIPEGALAFVIRLPNPASGYNNAVRVENEVASLSVARAALAPHSECLVPRVYGWKGARHGEGWIVQEYMPGRPLSEDFTHMDDKNKSLILGQMADILACLQRFELPVTIRCFGGLTFDSQGNFISAPMSIFDAGPFHTYEDLIRATIRSKLSESDEDVNVRGWRDNDVRSRIEKFLEHGLSSVMSPIRNLKKVLEHADLSVDNLLYDKETMQVTAVLDFDFSHVGTVADEFFRSLGHGIGRFPDCRSGDEDDCALQRAMLDGFPVPRPASKVEIDWTSAKAWNDALENKNAERPATIAGIDTLADLFWLSSQIFPFKLCNDVVVRNSSGDDLAKRRKEGEDRLCKFLEDYGF